MSGLARLAGIGFGLLLIQTLGVSLLPWWFRPELILIFALAMGLCEGAAACLVLAFFLGFAADVLSTSPMGLFSLLAGTACAVTRLVDRALYLRVGGPWAVYVAAYVLANAVLLGLVQRVFLETPPLPWPDLLRRMPGAALSTALLSAPLLSLILRMEAEPTHDSGLQLAAARGSRSPS